MPLTHNLWSGNSVEDQASTARAAERSAKIAQIKTGLGELAHILEGVVDVPENLRAIARATRQVVQAAQNARILKLDCLKIAEESLHMSMSVAFLVKIHGVREADMQPSLKEKLSRFACQLQNICQRLSGLTLNTRFSRMTTFFWKLGSTWKITKCRESLEHSRYKILPRDYQEYHPMRRETARRDISVGTSSSHLPTYSTVITTDINDASELEPTDLTGYVEKVSEHPVAHGAYGDVWKAVWKNQPERCMVAVKALRYCTNNEDISRKTNKRLRREIRLWQRLKHENILPLYGTTSGFGLNKSMVCLWAENGCLNEYLRRRGCNLNLIDRFRILRDVAAGLSYLHSNSIIHGDLTGSNVLIHLAGNACLSDFGMSTIIADCEGSNSFVSTTIGGSIRWAAVELYNYDHEDYTPTLNEYSDIYSFGSVMLQTLSGKIPYYYVATNDQVIAVKLVKRKLPRRPAEIANNNWNFIQKCWTDHERRERPSMAEISEYIRLHGDVLEDFLDLN